VDSKSYSAASEVEATWSYQLYVTFTNMVFKKAKYVEGRAKWMNLIANRSIYWAKQNNKIGRKRENFAKA